MSASAESSIAAVPPLSPSPLRNDFSAQMEVTEVTVNISFQFNETTQLWEATSDHETIVAAVGERLLITWILNMPTNGPTVHDLFFEDPGILFPNWQIPAPFLLVDDPLGDDRRRVVALWTNVDIHRQSKTFSYSLNVRINDQAVMHDPKVENDPPT